MVNNNNNNNKSSLAQTNIQYIAHPPAKWNLKFDALKNDALKKKHEVQLVSYLCTMFNHVLLFKCIVQC